MRNKERKRGGRTVKMCVCVLLSSVMRFTLDEFLTARVIHKHKWYVLWSTLSKNVSIRK